MTVHSFPEIVDRYYSSPQSEARQLFTAGIASAILCGASAALGSSAGTCGSAVAGHICRVMGSGH